MRFVAVCLLALGFCTSAVAEQSLVMLDFVYLNKDVEVAERDAYNAKAKPIAARHGVILRSTLDPVRIVLGPKGLQRLDLWTLPAPQALQAWSDDPDYLAMRSETLAVHDMKRLTLYLAREIGPVQIAPGRHYWVEFLRFDKSGFTGEQFAAYMRETDGIAGKYDLQRVATFGKVGRILGPGFEAHWMNIYSVPDSERLQSYVEDARFVELASMRERLFDLDSSMMAVFQSR